MPLASAIASGLSSLLGGVFNATQTQKMNRQTMDFTEHLYDKQFADNLKLWHLQNEYNSPDSQMQRFTKAGLNPNLIYGQGNAGNAGSISAPSPSTHRFDVPEFGTAIANGGLSFISSMYDLEMKEAQTDNLRTQNTIYLQDALLRAAQVEQTQANTARSKFDLGLESELRKVSVDARKEMLRQLRTNVDLSLRKDARDAMSLSSNLREAASRLASAREYRLNAQAYRARNKVEIRRIRADIDRLHKSVELMHKEGVLKDWEVKLSEQGINRTDPYYFRIGAKILETFFGFSEDDGAR